MAKSFVKFPRFSFFCIVQDEEAGKDYAKFLQYSTAYFDSENNKTLRYF